MQIGLTAPGPLHRRARLSARASLQAGVGHYGMFSGKRWNSETYPLLRDFVHVNSRGAGPDAANLKLTTKLHRT
jgi:hypothetical protein